MTLGSDTICFLSYDKSVDRLFPFLTLSET